MKKDMRIALVTYTLLLLLSFLMSIVLGCGKAESAREITSYWYYVRRGLLVITALGTPWFIRGTSPGALGWTLPGKWTLFALSAGITMGFLNQGGFDPTQPALYPLALFHTFSMELFFRGYLYTTLARSMENFWKPIIISALLYALFYQTTWTAWVQPVTGKIVFFFIFTCVGILFAYCYKKSGSFLVNWIMHICTGIQFRFLF
jgi:membrane protease YdiL (CAAX protease family)